ncbi:MULTISPECIES: hypothetical protein [Rhodococcus erythropolis group]|uniref:Uncharacterized protein n=1 Tax=Rhodococcus baikonurensis TaxID=172041 RepID=A0ABV5XPP3_9NOCA|nr:hypothetical protein [Rhodococcus qingshengii]MDJ0440200.1 hypothetical protein [Rhodococcus qingshengii]SCC69561.1 hypothetical protein GA0061093_1294 [Rhodococcus qingshengii]
MAVPQLVLFTAVGTRLISLALQVTSLAFAGHRTITGAATSTAVLAFTLLMLGLLI